MHKILVVDDEKKALVIAKKALGRDGYEILTSEHPDDALEIVEAKAPIAVVMSDERMPGMRGTEFLEQVKNLSPHTTRILMTGFYDKELLEKAVNKGGIFRFLQKPLDMKAVQKVVKEGIELYEESLASVAKTAALNKLHKEKAEFETTTEDMTGQISLLKKSTKFIIGVFAAMIVAAVGIYFISEMVRQKALIEKSETVGHWILYPNGTTQDTRTGLMWLVQDFRNIENRQPRGWQGAMDWAKRMSLKKHAGYSDWRVPTMAEYEKIYDPDRTRLAYDKKIDFPVGYPKVFANGGGYGAWSSQLSGQNKALYFFFIGGYERKANLLYDNPAMSVRLVR